MGLEVLGVEVLGVEVLGQVSLDRVPLTRRRERDLLCVLVAAQGRAVPVERLLAELWCESSTPGTTASLQVVVCRLRTSLDPTRAAGPTVEMTPAGYRLVVDPRSRVDAWAFDELAERALAARAPHDRLLLATRACELWTGAAYAESLVPSVRAEAARLEELHVTVQETRAEALVELGHPAAGVRLLSALAPTQPYREQLWALLARALYACSRQADALAALATLRHRLAEDLGVDPSACVRAMEQRILEQDAGLTPVPRTAPVVRREHGRVHQRVRLHPSHCRAGWVTGTLVAAH